MKLQKIIFIALLLSLSFCLNSLEVQNYGNYFQLQVNGELQEKVFIFAFPSVSATVEIVSSQADEYNEAGQYQRTTDSIIPEFISYQESFVMRELHGHSFLVHSSITKNNKTFHLKDLQFRIIPQQEISAPTQISPVFLPLYQSVVSNFDTSYLRDLATTAPKMLLLVPPPLVNSFNEFALWKKQLGIDVTIFTTNDTGTTNVQIKQFIQNRYNNEETRPDYILIAGDVDDAFTFPSYYFGTENNVTDQIYTFLDGNDYFPDALIGRFSIDSSFELATIISKQFRYEREPYTGNPNWFRNAVLVAGNYASSPPVPTTPKYVTMWLAEKMANYGFQGISEIYYPPTYPGTNQITAAINNGASFVSYRGWGDANGWHYPYYHTENLVDLNNGAMLPVMTSIVCNTGDFANSVDPCFGEAVLRIGTPSSPKGMVAFIGPSDLHTSTKFNNAIFAGFYSGLLDENIFTLGTALLRGKIELYQNFPLDINTGGQVEFYFHVYNILGDPALQMWTTIPQAIAANLPEQIAQGTNHLNITVQNSMNGAIVTAIQNNVIKDVSTIQNGNAILYLEELSSDNVLITISKPDFIPLIHTISVVTNSVDLGISEIVAINPLLAGQINAVNLTMKNYGNENSESITAQFGSQNPLISFVQNSVHFGVINAGASVTREVSIAIDANCPNQEIFEVAVELLPTPQTHKFELMVGSLNFDIVHFEVINNNGFLQPGAESTIRVTVKNIAVLNALNVSALVQSLSDAVTVITNSTAIGNVAIDQSAVFTFDAYVEADCYIGRPVSFDLNFSSDNGLQAHEYLTMEVGQVTNSAPTGPDHYGYFAYDSFDTGYSEAPTYFWHEIDPLEGGNGTVLLMGDDQSQNISLPFPFTFYGLQKSEITICSNGWISFLPTWMTNFRNWNIPSALGPYGMIAAYWDDLIGKLVGENHEQMRICYYHDSNENYFVIEWNEAYNRFDNASLEKFQLVLYNPAFHTTNDGNGIIQINYHTINNPDAINNYATVGIENYQQTDGVLYTYANLYPASATPLQNGLAVKFTTNPPDTYTSANENMIPAAKTKLFANYPNPFNPTTTISFEIPENGNVSLKIYDVKGRHIKTIIEEPMTGGFHSMVWNGDDQYGQSVTSGIYFYKLTVNNNQSQIKKCVLIK
jgi:hypothetical protein